MRNYWNDRFAADEKRFKSLIDALSAREIQRLSSIPKQLLMYEQGDIQVYYAPLRENRNLHSCSVLFVGLTPGQSQAIRAIQFYRGEAVTFGPSYTRGWDQVSFAGSMRKTMTGWLDELGLNKKLRLDTSEELFDRRRGLAVSTSLLKYPVLKRGANFSGGTKQIRNDQFLNGMVEEVFGSYLSRLNPNALVVPLGKTVAQEIARLVKGSPELEERCLFGFPHPSGLNGHRFRLFDEARSEMKRTIDRVFAGSRYRRS